jgi:hypothetical protein
MTNIYIDIDKIVEAFVNESRSSGPKFSIFYSLWENNSFALIFDAQPRGMHHEEHLQYLFNNILMRLTSYHNFRGNSRADKYSNDTTKPVKPGFTVGKKSFFVNNSCSLYVLYLLYFTQPATERIPVSMSLDQMNRLYSTVKLIDTRYQCDVWLCLHELLQNGAFVLHAQNFERVKHFGLKQYPFIINNLAHFLTSSKHNPGQFMFLKAVSTSYGRIRSVFWNSLRRKIAPVANTFIGNELSLTSSYVNIHFQNPKTPDSVAEIIRHNKNETKIESIFLGHIKTQHGMVRKLSCTKTICEALTFGGLRDRLIICKHCGNKKGKSFAIRRELLRQDLIYKISSLLCQ